MGKKPRGAKLRALKRAREAVEVLQEHQAEATVANDAFVVDRTGEFVPHHHRPQKKAKGEQQQKQQQASGGLSEHETKRVKLLLQQHGKEKVQVMARQGRKAMEQRSTRPRRTCAAHRETGANFDLWKDNNTTEKKEQDVVVKTSSTLNGIGSTMAGIAPSHVPIKALSLSAGKKKSKQTAVAVDVAKAGQSYHPDPEAHHQMIQKAADIEVARNTAIRNWDAPISQGLSAETKALMVHDDSSSESETEQEEMSDLPVGAIPKRAQKLTKAQRNKQKRVRMMLQQQQKAKDNKKLLNQVSEIPRYKKELQQKEKEMRQDRKQHDDAEIPGKDLDLKIPTTRRTAKDNTAVLIRKPTVPVALSNEIQSSLRLIKPKGSLALDRLISFTDRKLVTIRHDVAARRKRKLAVKGKRNSGGSGMDFEVLG